MSVWDTLEIKPTNDLRAIKRAYAVKLKVTRPDHDADAYQALREAFDAAKRLAKQYEFEEGSSNVDEPLMAEGSLNIDRSESELSEIAIAITDEPAIVVDETPQDELEVFQGSAVLLTEKSDEELSQEGALTSTDDSMSISLALDTEESIAQPLLAITDDESVQPAQETVSENDQLYSQAVDMVQAIHDCLSDKGEVAATAFFHQQLESPELFSLDLSKRFDSQMMSYLGWWSSRREEDEDLHLPLGFMRHILKHYAWHKDGVSSFQNVPALERQYEPIVNDNGKEFLEKVVRKELDYSSEYKVVAKRLLGKCKPKWFAVISIIGVQRDTAYALFDKIENLNDSSFDFELNTDTVKWWRASRGRFLFSVWMLVLGVILALGATLGVLNLALLYPQLNRLIGTPLGMLLTFLLTWAASSLLVYGLAFTYKQARDFVMLRYNKISGLQQELVLLIVAIPIIVFAQISAPVIAETSYFIAAMLLCVMYRTRVITLLIGLFFVTVGFSVDGVGDVLSNLNVYQIALPVLFVNTALFGGYTDFKAKQLKRRYLYSEIAKKNRIGLQVLLVASCFGLALLML